MKPPDHTSMAGALLASAREKGFERYLLAEPLVVGVSGGPDSLALLHALYTLRGADAQASLHVAHLDHGLRGEAGAEDARFVAQLAKEWNLPCTVRHFDVVKYAREHGLSVEEAARNVRYAFLAGLAAPLRSTVAVGHNADDQVETVLMNILRGSGPGGLRGMAMLATLPTPAHDDPGLAPLLHGALPGAVRLFRPLLIVWRNEIEAYCAAAGLHPRTDATNSDAAYTRNRIRHELIPLLQREYNPAIKELLTSLSSLTAAEDDLLETLTESEGRRLSRVDTDGKAVSFDPAAFAALPEALRLRLVRWALRRVTGTLDGFGHAHVLEAAAILSNAEGVKKAANLPHNVVIGMAASTGFVSLGGPPAGQSDGFAEQRPSMLPHEEQTILPGEAIPLLAGWHLESAVVSPGDEGGEPGELLALFDWSELQKRGPLALRTRRPGDTIQPLGMTGHKSLHDLFIDAKIPRRTREGIPVVALQRSHEVLWVPGPGGRRSALAPISPQTHGILRLEFIKSGEA
jgi:tRNA(Ile)-lysidine synthase